MHRPRHPDHQTIVHCPVSSFDLPGRKQAMAEKDEEEEENVSCYAACLTEDLQLFGQLNDLEQVQADDDLHLLQLTNETPSPSPPATPEPAEIPVRRKRAAPTKRQAHNICDICDICSRCFSDAYTLRIHRMTHTDERPHVCEECGKGFRQLSKLRMHAVIHTKERPHECDICGKGYRFANYLAVHRRLHTGEKPYGCTVTGCSLSFHSIHARRMHVKLQHGKAEKEGDQEEHEVHEEEEEEEKQLPQQPVAASLSYTCPVCGRILTDQCYLNTHLKRHYNQRDFVCPQPQCGKRFFSSSELNHHQITHIRLRRFRCTHCTSRFLRKSNYQQHLKLHQRPSQTEA